jgi:hypothetical protein
MTTNIMAFPVIRGLQGMNQLAQFLNAQPLEGGWHFGTGSRFDQLLVNIDFDQPGELAPTWRRYCDAHRLAVQDLPG